MFEMFKKKSTENKPVQKTEIKDDKEKKEQIKKDEYVFFVIGDKGVGKTMLMASICLLTTRPENKVSLVRAEIPEEIPCISYEFNNRFYTLIECSACDEVESLLNNAAIEIDGAILVMDNDGELSENVDGMVSSLAVHALDQKGKPCYITGFINKCDLEDDPDNIENLKCDIVNLLDSYNIRNAAISAIAGSAMNALESPFDANKELTKDGRAINDLIWAIDASA